MRRPVTFTRSSFVDRNLPLTVDSNKFAASLYSNLIIAEDSNAYSLGIQYAKQFIQKNFPDNYLKFFWVNGTHVFSDFNAFNASITNRQMVINREKPYATLIPKIDTDYNRENVDLYNAGADILLRRSDYQRAFLKDYDKKIFLGINMKTLRMNFEFRVRVATRAEEIDLFNRMKLLFRIGGTRSEFLSCDFLLPHDAVLNIADLAGFEIKNGEIVDPFAFQKYLNSKSEIPITYKFRAINGRNEFFLRMGGVYFHTSTKDNLDMDEGEREGALDNNYTITMQFTLQFTVPHFYALFDAKPLKYVIGFQRPDAQSIMMYSLAQFAIPNTDENGWNLTINTAYHADPKEAIIEIGDLFKGNSTTEIKKVIKYCIDNGISPKSFIDIKIYKGSGSGYEAVPCKINFDTSDDIKVMLGIVNEQPVYYYIGIYIDSAFLNETLITINEYNRQRISKSY